MGFPIAARNRHVNKDTQTIFTSSPGQGRPLCLPLTNFCHTALNRFDVQTFFRSIRIL
jgi:hypothetical protein